MLTQQTIINCFRNCGFVKEGIISIEQDEENLVLNDVVEVYNVIHGNGELSFKELVHFDNNTVVAETLTDR